MMSELSPTVSIIVPVHNAQAFLPACLDSLLFRQGDRVEVIAVDDGSKDGSRAILEQYSRRCASLRVIGFPSNQGVSAARNAGLDLARGEYVLFVDADDRLAPSAVPRLLETVEKDAPDIVLFQFRKIAESGKVLLEAPCIHERLYDLQCVSGQREAFDCVVGNLMAWNGLYKRTMLGDLRFACFPNGEDVLFGAQAYLRAKSVVHSALALYDYVQREGSASRMRTKRHCLSAIEVACEIFSSVHASQQYERVRDLLFRKVRGMAHGLTLNVLRSVTVEDRGACWDFWFDRFSRVFCPTDLVPAQQRWLYRAVFRSRSRAAVWLFFQLPIRVKAALLSSRGMRALWLKARGKLMA